MKILFDAFNKPNLDTLYEDLNECDNSYSYFQHKNFLVPQIFASHKDIIECYHVDQIEKLDFFIYPINFCNPFLDSKLNETAKFLDDIDVKILNRVKNNKGIILIDANYEPFGIQSCLSLKDKIKKAIGCDNIFINTRISSLYLRDNFFTNFVSFLELKSLQLHAENERLVTTDKKFCLFGLKIDKHKGGRELLKWFNKKNASRDGHVSLSFIYSNESHHTIPALNPNALNHAKFNIVVESYFDKEDTPDFAYLTEKIFRNIHYKKPFIVIGQDGTLKEFNHLGYKTYNDVFDESYDLFRDSSVRIHYVFKLLNKLIDEPEEFWDRNKEKFDSIHTHNIKNYEARLARLPKFYDEYRNIRIKPFKNSN